jgi:hypothetical protein
VAVLIRWVLACSLELVQLRVFTMVSKPALGNEL